MELATTCPRRRDTNICSILFRQNLSLFGEFEAEDASLKEEFPLRRRLFGLGIGEIHQLGIFF